MIVRLRIGVCLAVTQPVRIMNYQVSQTYLMPLGTARLWTNSTPDGVELIVRWSVPRLYVVLFEFSFEWSVLLQ